MITENTSAADALDEAMRLVERDDDGAFDEKAVLDLAAEIVSIDIDRQRYRLVKTELDRRTRPPTDVDEAGLQLCIPGIEPYTYEPDRLIKDDEHHLIEQDRALVRFKFADARRSQKNLNHAHVWNERKHAEANAFSEWVVAQIGEGRDGKALTFGAFIRETGWLVTGAQA